MLLNSLRENESISGRLEFSMNCEGGMAWSEGILLDSNHKKHLQLFKFPNTLAQYRLSQSQQKNIKEEKTDRNGLFIHKCSPFQSNNKFHFLRACALLVSARAPSRFEKIAGAPPRDLKCLIIQDSNKVQNRINFITCTSNFTLLLSCNTCSLFAQKGLLYTLRKGNMRAWANML